MSQPKEIQRVTPEQPQVFEGTLGGIVSDVQFVVKNWQAAAGEYSNLEMIVPHQLTLQKQKDEERLHRAFRMLAFLEREQFTALPPQQKRKKVYEITRNNSHVLEIKLAQLYKEFLDQPPTERGAWRKFVEAFQVFGADYRHSGFSAIFPPVSETSTIEMPRLTEVWKFEYDGTGPETAKENTRLQEDLARAIGVLLPGETLGGFIHRETIKTVGLNDWKEFNRLENEEPEVIPGIQAGYHAKKLFYTGTPFYYSVLTKYPGVRANIRFGASRDYREMPLDESLNAGCSTVGITLHVPTELFFLPQSHT